MKLSVVIITYNEERNIGRCLENIQDLVDEIIVVDSFSTDNTEKICNGYPVKFIKNPFEGNIRQQCFACSQASHEYILSLDADEVLGEELKNNIRNQKERGFNKDAYIMNRCTNFCGHWIKHGMWYPDKKLRIYRTAKGSWGGIEPHGLIVMKPKSSTGYLKGDILHYSYHSLEEVIIRNNKYTNIMAKTMFHQPFVGIFKWLYFQVGFFGRQGRIFYRFFRCISNNDQIRQTIKVAKREIIITCFCCRAGNEIHLFILPRIPGQDSGIE
jgi:glycosyltransferase involved in cell wall biosynthesis